ncbi:methyltransferase-like protein 25B isoform X2 [Diachasmimorpha longicaudata]|uniref:methyltransferase-like protein 25B isoform X2 n=1 Tax=Diachasmimorpha longicaudata TaxID=58733 RepID=UPI0030B894BF
MKTFAEDLEDNLSFIEKYERIINSHLVDFIAENLWETLPKDLRTELEQFENEPNFSHLTNYCPTLRSIIDETFSLNLRNNPKVLKLEDLPSTLLKHASNWENNCLQASQNDFMKDKKRYEISVLSKVVGSLAADKRTIVIDAGGGKGYLGTYLAEKYSVPVLSIDSNPGRNSSAINRQKLMEKKKNQSFSLTRHSVQFIDENTDFSKLVECHFPNWSADDYLLTGLHTCGPLAHAMIKSFINSDALKSLCVVSCCYHLTDEFLTTRINFTKTMRMLAQQSVERISAKNCEYPVSIFYRALLQVLLRSLGIPDETVGRAAPTEDFPSYAKWALEKIGLPSHKLIAGREGERERLQQNFE